MPEPQSRTEVVEALAHEIGILNVCQSDSETEIDPVAYCERLVARIEPLIRQQVLDEVRNLLALCQEEKGNAEAAMGIATPDRYLGKAEAYDLLARRIERVFFPDPPETQGGDAVERRSSAEPVPVMTRRGAGESGSPPVQPQWLCPECGSPTKDPPNYTCLVFGVLPAEYFSLSELADLLTSDEVKEAVARGIAVEGDSVFAWEQMPKAHNRSERKAEKLRADTQKHCRTLSEAALQAAIASIKGEGHG